MPDPDRLTELRTAGELQRRICHDLGSPTYAGIIDAIVDRLDTDGPAEPAVRLLLEDRQPAVESALYLRLLGAVHRRALSDPDCPLRAYFPTTGGRADISGAVVAFFTVVAGAQEQLERELQVTVQTNEVGRSAPLSAALSYLSAATRMPVRLLEVGASAGLNLWLDRYFVDAGSVSWGSAVSPVQLRNQFVSGTLPRAQFSVTSRRGCDRHPIDLTDPCSRQVLRSFVWPEHVERLRRLDAALSVAGPVPIDRADAVGWVSQSLRELPTGVTTVLFHSITLPYLPEPRRAEFARRVRQAGERADESRRLAWVSLEPIADYQDVWLVCERWPERSRIRLARTNGHGAEIRWAPTPLPVS